MDPFAALVTDLQASTSDAATQNGTPMTKGDDARPPEPAPAAATAVAAMDGVQQQTNSGNEVLLLLPTTTSTGPPLAAPGNSSEKTDKALAKNTISDPFQQALAALSIQLVLSIPPGAAVATSVQDTAAAITSSSTVAQTHLDDKHTGSTAAATVHGVMIRRCTLASIQDALMADKPNRGSPDQLPPSFAALFRVLQHRLFPTGSSSTACYTASTDAASAPSVTALPSAPDIIVLWLVSCMQSCADPDIVMHILHVIERIGKACRLTVALRALINLLGDKPDHEGLARGGERRTRNAEHKDRTATDVFQDKRSTEVAARLRVQLMYVIQRIARRDEQPHAFFKFKNTPIYATLRQAPNARGYSWATWIRLKEINPENNIHVPLFGFMDDDGTGVQIYMSATQPETALPSQSYDPLKSARKAGAVRARILARSFPQSSTLVPFNNFEMRTGRWYHVAIVHRAAKSLSRSSTALRKAKDRARKISRRGTATLASKLASVIVGGSGTGGSSSGGVHPTSASSGTAATMDSATLSQALQVDPYAAAIQLYIDGSLCSSLQLDVPVLKQQTPAVIDGQGAHTSRSDAHGSTSVESTSGIGDSKSAPSPVRVTIGGFFGDMAQISLFDEAVLPSVVRSLYALGCGVHSQPSVHASGDSLSTIAVFPARVPDLVPILPGHGGLDAGSADAVRNTPSIRRKRAISKTTSKMLKQGPTPLSSFTFSSTKDLLRAVDAPTSSRAAAMFTAPAEKPVAIKLIATFIPQKCMKGMCLPEGNFVWQVAAQRGSRALAAMRGVGATSSVSGIGSRIRRLTDGGAAEVGKVGTAMLPAVLLPSSSSSTAVKRGVDEDENRDGMYVLDVSDCAEKVGNVSDFTHTKMLAGVDVHVAQSISTSFAALGGFKMLFYAASPVYAGAYYHSDADIATLLSLIASLLQHNAENQRQFLELGSACVKKLLIDPVPKSMRTRQLLSSCMMLVVAVKGIDGTPRSSHFVQFLSDLILDLSFWRDTPDSRVLVELVDFVFALVQANAELFAVSKYVNVLRFLDNIRILYLDKFAVDFGHVRAASSVALVSASSASASQIKSCPDQNDLSWRLKCTKRLCQCLVALLRASDRVEADLNEVIILLFVTAKRCGSGFGGESSGGDDTSTACNENQVLPPTSMIHYDKALSSLLEELIGVFVRMCIIAPAEVLPFLHMQHAQHVFVELVGDVRESVRCGALHILGFYLQYVSSSATSADANRNRYLVDISQVIRRKLMPHEKSEAVLRAVFGMATGMLVVRGSDTEKETAAMMTEPSAPNVIFAANESRELMHSAFIDSLLQLLGSPDVGASGQQRVLLDVLALLRSNVKNLTTASSFFWQRHLVQFLVRKEKEDGLKSSGGIGVHPVTQVSMMIASCLLWYSMVHEEHGSIAIDELMWAVENVCPQIMGSTSHDIWEAEVYILVKFFTEVYSHLAQLSTQGSSGAGSSDHDLLTGTVGISDGNVAGGATEEGNSFDDDTVRILHLHWQRIGATSYSLPSKASAVRNTFMKRNIFECYEQAEHILFCQASSFLRGASVGEASRLAARVSMSMRDAAGVRGGVEAAAIGATVGAGATPNSIDVKDSGDNCEKTSRAVADKNVLVLLLSLLHASTHHFSVSARRQDILRVLFRFLQVVLPHPLCVPLCGYILRSAQHLFAMRISARTPRNFTVVAVALSLMKDAMEVFMRRNDQSHADECKTCIYAIVKTWGVQMFTMPLEGPDQAHMDNTSLEDVSSNADNGTSAMKEGSGRENEADEDAFFYLYQHDVKLRSMRTLRILEKHQDVFNVHMATRRNKQNAIATDMEERRQKLARTLLGQFNFAANAHAELLSQYNAEHSLYLQSVYTLSARRHRRQHVSASATATVGPRTSSSGNAPAASPRPSASSPVLTSVAAVYAYELSMVPTSRQERRLRVIHKVMKSYHSEWSHTQKVVNYLKPDVVSHSVDKLWFPFSEGVQREFWKIDPTEAPVRSRPLLRKNYAGSRYLYASSVSKADGQGCTANAAHESELQKLGKLAAVAKKQRGDGVERAAEGDDSADGGEAAANDETAGANYHLGGDGDESGHTDAILNDDVYAEGSDDGDWIDEDISAGKPSTSGASASPRAKAQEAARKRAGLVNAECTMITPLRQYGGVFSVTRKFVTFFGTEVLPEEEQSRASVCGSPSGNAVASLASHGKRENEKVALKKKFLRWTHKSVRLAMPRTYQLRESAIELFLNNGTNYFFTFASSAPRSSGGRRKAAWEDRNRVFRVLCAQLKAGVILSGARRLAYAGITKQWQRRQLSNFDYLMHLNTIAGRSYNDINQYPVFPWIIADYTSSVLDLSDPATFRDLSKPCGRLTEQRWKIYSERYKSFEDEEIPPFHYGSHYSSAGIALYYLLRLEPFTQLAINLQSGKFDLPDRLFTSVESAWRLTSTNVSDVKELIPEFFYLPDFLRNVNGLKLGVTQDKRIVDDVILPPWANGSPEEFIRIQREALESDYVSAHLHEWIDLIFGFKQKGPAAEAAGNVFFYLTYAGAIDIDSIEDGALRKATEDQIAHFGQTPAQLLTSPHPPRYNRDDCPRMKSFPTLPCHLPRDYCGQHIFEYLPPVWLRESEQLRSGDGRQNRGPKRTGESEWGSSESQSVCNLMPKLISFIGNVDNSILTVGENLVVQQHDIIGYAAHTLGKSSILKSAGAEDEADLSQTLEGDGSQDAEARIQAALNGGGALKDSKESEEPSSQPGSLPLDSRARIIPSNILSSMSLKLTCSHDCGSDAEGFMTGGNNMKTNSPLTRQQLQLRHKYSSSVSCTVYAINRKRGMVYSAGYVDGTVRCHQIYSQRQHATVASPTATRLDIDARPISSVQASHAGPLTCMALSHDCSTLMTGGEDGTVVAWRIPVSGATAGWLPLTGEPAMRFSCHDGKVISIAIESRVGVVVSLASAGPNELTGSHICVYSTRRGRFVRDVKLPKGYDMRRVLMTPAGNIVLYGFVPVVAATGSSVSLPHLVLLSLNGQFMGSAPTGERLSVVQCSPFMDSSLVHRALIITGGERSRVVLRSASNLQVLQVLHCDDRMLQSRPVVPNGADYRGLKIEVHDAACGDAVAASASTLEETGSENLLAQYNEGARHGVGIAAIGLSSDQRQLAVAVYPPVVTQLGSYMHVPENPTAGNLLLFPLPHAAGEASTLGYIMDVASATLDTVKDEVSKALHRGLDEGKGLVSHTAAATGMMRVKSKVAGVFGSATSWLRKKEAKHSQ